MNRLYYSVFYAVSAMLLERGTQFVKHSGVRAAFHRDFVKTGLVAIDWEKFYDQLFEDRQEGDYLAMAEFDKEYVSELMDKCRRFLLVLEPLYHFYPLIHNNINLFHWSI